MTLPRCAVTNRCIYSLLCHTQHNYISQVASFRLLTGHHHPYMDVCTFSLHVLMHIGPIMARKCRSQWPRGVRRRSAAARLLRSWVRIPPGAWIFVCCECRVLSGRGLCDELITRPEDSYRLWCVVVCDLEKNLKNEEAMTRVGSQGHRKKKIVCK